MRVWAITILVATAAAAATNYEEEGRRWWAHVEYLASDKLEGRDTGSPGHRKAAEYVAAEFERLRLKPAGTQSYFQPVPLRVRELDEANCSLALVRADGTSTALKLGEDANLGLRGDPVRQVEAAAVFVGYGLQIPEHSYDDLAGVDVKGKVAVVLQGAPSFLSAALAAHLGTERWMKLREKGAIGMAMLADPRNTDVPWQRSTLNRLHPSMSLRDPELNVQSAGLQLSIAINPAQADKWFAGTGHTAAEIFSLAQANKPLPTFDLPLKVRAAVAFRESETSSDNVAALLPGADPRLKDEYVVLSAHLDHVGTGGEINGDRVYNGAMDNASGTATLIEIARLLEQQKQRLKRSVIFVAVTGEEKGLLGSKFFAAKPTVRPEQIVANLNVDMFLPIVPLKSLVVYGLEESDLGDAARAVGAEMSIGIVPDREPKRNLFVRSDQYNFIRKGVPALSFKFDAEPGSPDEAAMKEWIRIRYHAPSDDLQQPVDKQGAARFNDFIARLAARAANRAERPQWKPASFFRRFARGKA